MPQQNNLQSTSQEQSSQQKQQTNANNQQTQQRYDYDHNGVYRTPAEQKHMNSGLRISRMEQAK